jgi:hypothetical protein
MRPPLAPPTRIDQAPLDTCLLGRARRRRHSKSAGQPATNTTEPAEPSASGLAASPTGDPLPVGVRLASLPDELRQRVGWPLATWRVAHDTGGGRGWVDRWGDVACGT